MKIAHIVPSAYISHIVDTRYHLVLPWNIEEVILKVDGWIILDNGAAEAQSLSLEDLIDLTNEYGTRISEVVAPDVLRDMGKTVRLSNEFKRQLDADVHIMVVAQGTTVAEVKECIYRFANQGGYHTLAIPKHLPRTLSRDYIRMEITTWFHDLGLVESFPGGIHYLGATDWIREPIVLSELPNTRGMDTSMAAIAALKHKFLTELGHERLDRPSTFFTAPLDYRVLKYLITNTTTYEEWTHGSN